MLELQCYIPERYWWDQGIACQLLKMFSDLPRRKGTKFYYDFLLELRGKQGEKQEEGSSSNSSNNNSSNDENDQMKDALDSYDKMSEDQKDMIQRMLEEELHEEWSKIIDKLQDGNMKDLVKSQTEYQMKETAKNSKDSRGMWPSELYETLDALFRIKPPVFNWKNYFKRLLGNAFDIYQKKTRRKESKRFDDCPGLRLRKRHNILVALDTSGSVSQEEYAEFFSELHHIYKAGARIHVLECDAAICKEYDYKGQMPEVMYGRGGTAFTPCVDYYNKHYREYTTMVYFTDGYGDQDECKPIKNMIWIITQNGNQHDKFPGIKVCIPKD